MFIDLSWTFIGLEKVSNSSLATQADQVLFILTVFAKVRLTN
jgi:hypothetical protein